MRLFILNNTNLNGKKHNGMGLSILFDGLLRATQIKDNQKRVFIPYKHKTSILSELRKNGWITIISHNRKAINKEEAKIYNCSHILNGTKIEEL